MARNVDGPYREHQDLDMHENLECSARRLAIGQLCRKEIGKSFVGAGTGPRVGADQSRQITDLVSGVTRWRRYLDFLIRYFYAGSFRRMEPQLKQILRIAVYELILISKPPYAVLHEAVSLAKGMVRPGAGRLVNAILRALLRRVSTLPQPDTGDTADDLGIAFSHPTWMVRRWLGRFGAHETTALLEWNNTRPVYALRHNPRKISATEFRERLTQLGVEWKSAHYLEDFVRVWRLQAVIRAGWLQEGLCAVQDESAGLAVHVLDARPGETILDMCAAPGGKALYAAARMQDRGRIIALDLHEKRLDRLKHAAVQQCISIVEPHVSDARTYAASTQVDRVLVDAPCSGLGVLAKRSDLRWNRSLHDLEPLQKLQDALLDAAAAFVRPGGILVYATCTIEGEENEARVDAFLKRQPMFRVDPVREPAPIITPHGYLATLPHVHGMDGAFAARLHRNLANK